MTTTTMTTNTNPSGYDTCDTRKQMKYHQYYTDSTTASSDHRRIRVAAITTSRTSTSVSIIQEILKHMLVSSIVSFKQQQQSTTGR